MDNNDEEGKHIILKLKSSIGELKITFSVLAQQKTISLL
jgi:hypothetical protein